MTRCEMFTCMNHLFKLVSLGLVDILSVFSSHENSFHHTLITYIFEESVP